MYDILQIIRVIRDSFDGSVDVYTKGSCIKFAMILKCIFPLGSIMYNQDHAVFLLDGVAYDINGYADINDNYIKIEDYGIIDSYYYMSHKSKVKLIS